jgi:Flp pilus assembly protein TadD
VESVTIAINDLFEFEGQPVPAQRPDDSAIEAMARRQFAFLRQPVQIHVGGGTVTVSFPEGSSSAQTEASRLADKAAKRANEGNYNKAISIWKRVLELDPSLHKARRDLAMSCMETGDIEGAKNHLIDLLRLNPADAWGWVVLGNLYAKSEKDWPTAEKFLRRALEIAPSDPWALNGLAAIAAQRGQTDEAVKMFEQAIAANPEVPNPYYGLGVTFRRTGQPALAARALDRLFACAKLQDVRAKHVFDQARALYAGLQDELAKQQQPDAFKAVENLRAELEARSGYPVRQTEGEFKDTTGATIQMAWKHGRDHHLIRCRRGFPPHLLTHLVAHELTHLRLESDARQVGKNRFFSTTATTERLAMDAIQGDLRKIQRSGYPQEAVQGLGRSLITGLANFLNNCPLDMLIETRLRAEMPVLRSPQFRSLLLMAQESWDATTHGEVRQVTPPIIMRASLALNGAFALFLDGLFQGATDLASRYQKLGAFDLSQKLLWHWQSRSSQLGPGDEYALVDEFGDMLGVRGWFAWQPDSGAHAVTSQDKEGTTNPRLLREKSTPAVHYCLDALKRYDKMPVEKIREIAFEIGMVGRNGLDYASPDPKYTLKSLPGEQFSGLHLMCLMFAGFKRIAPEHDLGMDLNDPFLTALEMFQKGETAQ